MIISSTKKISQTLIINIPTKKDLNMILPFIKNYSIGGIILGDKVFDTIEELSSIIQELNKCIKRNNTGAFISITSLPKECIKPISPSKLGNKDLEFIKLTSYATCCLYNELGINLTLGPSLDLKTKNNFEAFTSNYRKTCEIYDTFIPAYKKYKVLPIISHFPGNGNAVKILNKKVINHYPTKDLTPFEHAIKKGCNAILLDNVILSNINKLKVISLDNNYINKYIRDYYNYNGLIISEEINIPSISKQLNSGCDMVILKYHRNIESIIKKLAKKYDDGKLNINESYKRIIDIKNKYTIGKIESSKEININKYNIQIEKVNTKKAL